jgi:hypothetical protein
MAEADRCQHGGRDYSLLVMTPTNAQARQVGLAIRQHRREAGELSAVETTLKARDPNSGETFSLAAPCWWSCWPSTSLPFMIGIGLLLAFYCQPCSRTTRLSRFARELRYPFRSVL